MSESLGTSAISDVDHFIQGHPESHCLQVPLGLRLKSLRGDEPASRLQGRNNKSYYAAPDIFHTSELGTASKAASAA